MEANRVPVRALHDTGCTLRDPMTGERVLVAEADALAGASARMQSITARCACTTRRQLLLRLKTRAPALPARLLSYKCVGTQAGLILCLRCEIQVRPGVRKRCLAAFSPTPVSDGGNYDALIGGTDWMKLEAILQKLGLLQPGKIMYIGGSDVLPAPLKPEQERQTLVAALQQGDEAAKQTLIEHNLRLVVYIARRFENTGVNLEDLISIGTIGLIKAVGTFRPDRNIKLATYSSRCIENEILMHIRKIAEPEDGGLARRADQYRLGRQRAAAVRCARHRRRHRSCARWRTMWTTSFCGRRLERLPEREKQIVSMRFGLGGTAGEDAEGGRGSDGDFPVVYFPAGKAHYAALAPGDLPADLQLRRTSCLKIRSKYGYKYIDTNICDIGDKGHEPHGKRNLPVQRSNVCRPICPI